MAQDAIILYENGKAIGGEGHPTNASDITFDNTGTDLVSEEVESAIKEVNDKTKHGIVELWFNSSPSSNFAGQGIQIQNFDRTKFDAIIIAMAYTTSETYAPIWYEYDLDLALASGYQGDMFYLNMSGGTSKVERCARTGTFSLSGNTLTITIGDGGKYTQNAIGSAATFTTDNTRMIPMRIFGLIHNS